MRAFSGSGHALIDVLLTRSGARDSAERLLTSLLVLLLHPPETPNERKRLSPAPHLRVVPDPQTAPVPPQNLEAEENVLGAMMMSEHALATVLEILRPSDFYRESHGAIFHAAGVLFAEGKPVDAIILTDALEASGRLGSVGGRVRVHELAYLVPATANAGHYARIVKEMATLRAGIAAGGEISRSFWERSAATPELVDRAQHLVYGISEGDRSHDPVPIGQTMLESYKTLEEFAASGRELVGVPTGFRALDRMTAGLQPGNLIIIAARPSMGKALSLDSNVLTPNGWCRMGDLALGDLVIGADGRTDIVAGVYDQGERELFRVELADGTSAECCDEHLWQTRTRDDRRNGRPGQARPLNEIRATLKRADSANASNHSIPYVEPVWFAHNPEPLPLDPYWLGLYLGDGDSGGNIRLSNPEQDLQRAFSNLLPPSDMASRDGIVMRVRRAQRTNQVSEAKESLTELGLDGLGSAEKFIPRSYLLATPDERLSVLQGLCDTDGYVTDPSGAGIEFSTVSDQLRDDIIFLVQSLGGRATHTSRNAHYVAKGVRHEASKSHRVVISFPRGGVTPVRSVKHLAKWRGGPHARGRERFISNIVSVGTKPCRCITVTRELFVTDGFAVTHNSALAHKIAANLAVKGKVPVLLFSLEMSEAEVSQRLWSMNAGVEGNRVRAATLSKEEWGRVQDAVSLLQDAPLYIDDSPLVRVTEIRSKARRLKTRVPDLGLVVVDYLQLMTSGQNLDNRVQEVSQISRALKILARDLELPVIALSQLSRAVEQRPDKRPILSDLRESGSIEQDADVVAFVYRDHYYNKNAAEREAEIIVSKQRNGPTGVVKVSFERDYARFAELGA